MKGAYVNRSKFLKATAGIAAVSIGEPAQAAQTSDATALVLSGGGALGAYEAGVAAGLAQSGIKIDFILGTSIGAINGALLSEGQADGLEKLWTSIAQGSILKLKSPVQLAWDAARAIRNGINASTNVDVIKSSLEVGNILSTIGLYDHIPVDDLLSQHPDLKRLRIPLAVVATNVDLGSWQAFAFNMPPAIGNPSPNRVHKNYPIIDVDTMAISNRNYRDIIRASGALPIIFDPVRIGSQHYLDGGIAANAPLSLARYYGATKIITVFMDPYQPGAEKPPQNLADLLLALWSANQRRALNEEARDVEYISNYPLQLYEFRPTADLGLSLTSFTNQQALTDAFKIGFSTGRFSSPTLTRPDLYS